MASQHFLKEDRLCSSRRIETLFSEGERLYEFPFKAIWQEDDTLQSTVKVAISVPKKRLSKASQRNHIKRLVREAYRKQKSILTEKLLQENKSINLMLVYNLPSILSYAEIEDKKQIALVGMGKKFEVWNVDSWEMRQTGGSLSTEILDVVLPESIKSMSF